MNTQLVQKIKTFVEHLHAEKMTIHIIAIEKKILQQFYKYEDSTCSRLFSRVMGLMAKCLKDAFSSQENKSNDYNMVYNLQAPYSQYIRSRINIYCCSTMRSNKKNKK